jgi:hypothetical protein
MPLPPAQSRKLVHTREVRCLGFERDDGLWDIEGTITDVKAYSFENFDRGTIAAGVPLHEMRVRLTLDDNMVVKDISASTEYAPFRACPEAADAVRGLIGERVAAGWTKKVLEKLNGVKGCTHIMQLILGPLATAAFQTINPALMKRKRDAGIKDDPTQKPMLLDTCYGWAAGGDMVQRRWPNFYTPAPKQ